MKSLSNLTGKDQTIVETILMRCEREWVNPKQLAAEFHLPNSMCLTAYFRMLRAEGYVFQRRVDPFKSSWYRLVDYKPKTEV